MQQEKMTTVQMAKIIHVSQPTASRFKNGKMPMQFEDAARLVEKVRSPFLAIDLANKTIQVSAPVINGDEIVKEPLAMAIRSVAEMNEAIDAVNNAIDELTTPVKKVKDNHDPMNAIDQLLDVMLYATNSVAFIAQEYGVSMQDKLATRTLEWRRLGLVGD
jgi:predicted transcriptional regulator